jgi:hypothetical protein
MTARPITLGDANDALHELYEATQDRRELWPEIDKVVRFVDALARLTTLNRTDTDDS